MFRRRDLRSTLPAASVPVEREPASPRFSSLLGAGWRWLVRLNARIDDSWVGDLLGLAGLLVGFVSLLIMAGVLQ